LAIIAPFVERHVQAFGALAGGLSRDYTAACREAGTAPDTPLLDRVARALGGGPKADLDLKQSVVDKSPDNGIMNVLRKGMRAIFGFKS
jgi:hypothetical protein